MIKLADSSVGSIDSRSVKKTLTGIDKERLNEGVDICKEIVERCGIRKDGIFLGTINAGHPGGMLPLTRQEARTFHNPRLPENLYVADSTLFPHSWRTDNGIIDTATENGLEPFYYIKYLGDAMHSLLPTSGKVTSKHEAPHPNLWAWGGTSPKRIQCLCYWHLVEGHHLVRATTRHA